MAYVPHPHTARGSQQHSRARTNQPVADGTKARVIEGVTHESDKTTPGVNRGGHKPDILYTARREGSMVSWPGGLRGIVLREARKGGRVGEREALDDGR